MAAACLLLLVLLLLLLLLLYCANIPHDVSVFRLCSSGMIWRCGKSHRCPHFSECVLLVGVWAFVVFVTGIAGLHENGLRRTTV